MCAPAISHCPLRNSCPVGCCIRAALPTLCLSSSGNLVTTFPFPGSGPSLYSAARSASGFLESPVDGWGPWKIPAPLIPTRLEGRRGQMHLRRLPQLYWENQVWTCYSCLQFCGLQPLDFSWNPLVLPGSSPRQALCLTSPSIFSLTPPGLVSPSLSPNS